ncbi:MAG: hypothetical protein ABI867_14555 [Kofleriaceae bacterium]
MLRWLGEGKVAPAVAAVQPEMRTQSAARIDDELVSDHAEVFDELYARVDESRPLDATFITKLNESNEALTTRWEELAKQRLSAIHAGTGTG